MSDVDLDAILDVTLDDLEDLPEFKVFPPGAHRVSVSLEVKEINKHPAIELSMKLLETLEMADPQEDPMEPGTECSTAYMMDNKFGQGAFKEVTKAIGASLGTSSLREIVEATKDLECVVITTIRKDKNDPDKKYINIKQLDVV